MENIYNYSNYVIIAYTFADLVIIGLMGYVVVKYLKTKKKLNAK